VRESITIKIGDWVAKPTLNRLERNGRVVKLEPRAMEVLVHLASRAGQLVSADELIDAVLDGRVVGDGAIYQSINQLRQALGDSTQDVGFIETIPKRGYRLIAAVKPLDLAANEESDFTDGRHSLKWKTGLAGAGVLALILALIVNYVADEEQPNVLPNSVAILLCDNLSPNPDDAYFAAGMHEEILNQLFKIRALNVIARTSVMQYADAPPPISQIADELNVGAVMECSVRFAGNSILVTAQLIDPETNIRLWSETYPGDLSDLSAVFAMQADIAMNIANALEAEFSLIEQERIEQIPTDSAAAYQLYLRARSFLDDSWMADLDKAIALDPEFGLAYALRAFLHAMELKDPVEAAALAPVVKENAERALGLDPTIGMAHSALARVHIVEGNLVEAQAAFQRASELTPNEPYILSTYAQFKRYVGEYADAIRLNRRSVELDPNQPFSYSQLGWSYWNAHDYDAAATAFQRFIDLVPANDRGHYALGFVEASRGNYDVAVTELQIAEQLAPEGLAALRLGQSAFAYGRMGRTEDASRLFSMLEDIARTEPVAEAVWALAYCAVSEYDEAYRRLVNAVNTPSVDDQFPLTIFKANAFGDPVLKEPRWQELRDRIGALD